MELNLMITLIAGIATVLIPTILSIRDMGLKSLGSWEGYDGNNNL